MKIFKINKELSIVCESKNTRNGFKHEAVLLKDGWKELEKTKICYLNRTWECFEYESVIQQLLGKIKPLTERKKANFLKRIERKTNARFKSNLNTIKMVASLGNVFGKTKKEKNDWKTRMLKAGLSDKGLIMPSDWDQLSEKEKEGRLNKVISVL